ncbi:ABC transporter ATP-binding protein [Chloroflexota bacterium]
MDDEITIKVDHVSKKFCRYLKRSMLYSMQDIGRNLLGMSTKSDKLRKDEFWAVDYVSFEVRRGETLGIIGANGSGKTTLLRMLNGIFMPEKGKIEVKGRVGALIDIGAGFHPMLTGRENIYIKGTILGMSNKEMYDKFDGIVAFADIGDFLGMPVKNYSSGMQL